MRASSMICSRPGPFSDPPPLRDVVRRSDRGADARRLDQASSDPRPQWTTNCVWRLASPFGPRPSAFVSSPHLARSRHRATRRPQGPCCPAGCPRRPWSAGLGIGLADDLGQPGGRHSRLLQLGKGGPRADGTQLLHFTHQPARLDAPPDGRAAPYASEVQHLLAGQQFGGIHDTILGSEGCHRDRLHRSRGLAQRAAPASHGREGLLPRYRAPFPVTPRLVSGIRFVINNKIGTHTVPQVCRDAVRTCEILCGQ